MNDPDSLHLTINLINLINHLSDLFLLQTNPFDISWFLSSFYLISSSECYCLKRVICKAGEEQIIYFAGLAHTLSYFYLEWNYLKCENLIFALLPWRQTN